MDNIIFKCGMRRVVIMMLIFLILFLILTIFLIISCISPQDDSTHVIRLIQLFCAILIDCILLFYFIYASVYSVTLTNNELTLKTLTKKKQIKFKDIKFFKFNKYFKSGFYQFIFVYNIENSLADQIIKVSISTSQFQKFVNLLKEAGINEIIS